MFEHFDYASRKAMALAQQEAVRRNHEYIGSEHILIGLMREANGLAAAAINGLGVNVDRVSRELDAYILNGPDPAPWSTLPYSPRGKKVIQYAVDEARDLNSDVVGTEHVLLGVLKEWDGVAAQILGKCGLTLSEVRHAVHDLLGRAPEAGE